MFIFYGRWVELKASALPTTIEACMSIKERKWNVILFQKGRFGFKFIFQK